MTIFNPLLWPYVSFKQTERLPQKPGIYFVIVNVTLKPGAQVPVVPHLSVSMRNAIGRGEPLALCLYVGQTGNFNKRWSYQNGKSAHHKYMCVRVLVSVLARFCTIGNLRIHYAPMRGGKGQKARLEKAEGILIRQLRPPLNGLAPIFRKLSKKERSNVKRVA